MTRNDMGEFSEFELQELYMKIGTATKHEECGAVGTAEEELDAKTITKNYRGVPVKKRTKGTGAGTLKLNIHMNYEKYCLMFGMYDESLKTGVRAYGMDSKHPDFSLTAKVLNEDDETKYKAYPNCTVTSSLSRKIENGGEEVAEAELEIAIQPDEYGYGMYEARAEDIEDAELASAWMEDFTPELVRVSEENSEEPTNQEPTV